MSNFVTILLKESKKREQKKAMLPPSINQLKNQATKLFKIQPPNKIQSIYTADGTLITSISEITHGMEILVSTQIPEEEFESPSQPIQEAPKSSPLASPTYNKTKSPTSPKQSPPPNSSSGMKIVQPPPVSPSPVFGSQSPKVAVTSSGRQTPIFGQLNEPPKSNPTKPTASQENLLQSQSPRTLSPILSPKSPEGNQLYRNTSGLAVIQQSTQEGEAAARAGSPKAPKRNTITRDLGEEVVAEMLSPDEQERRQMLARGVDRDVIINEITNHLDGLFSDQVAPKAGAAQGRGQQGRGQQSAVKDDEEAPQQVHETLKQAIRQVPPIIQRFMTNTNSAETNFRAYIEKSVEAELGEIPQISSSLEGAIGELVTKGTFATLGGFNVNFKTLIVGPRSSGKSTYLKATARSVYKRLIASGQFRHTFLFNIDFEQIRDTFTDLVAFYNTIVEHTFTQVANQRVEFQPFVEQIIQYFKKLLLVDTCIQLPTKFSLQDDFRSAAFVLTELATNIFNAYKKSGLLSMFMTNVVTIPNFVARAFGFNRVLIIADHIDLADVLVPANEFVERDTQNMPIVEFIKLMLDDNQFIISCKDERHAIEAIDLISDDSTDILSNTDIVSVIDSDKDENHCADIYFKLQVLGQPQPTLLRLEDLGGCPGFLYRWDIIISMAQQYIIEQRKDQNSRKLKEIKLALITKIRELVSLVFAEDGDYSSIAPYPGKINDFEIIQNTPQE